MNLPFFQVDVFGGAPFKGNPVAVILDGDKLTSSQMLEIANWTNLSETTFVCEPTTSNADYRLRIFTTQGELPFAGHPTIGSATALLAYGLTPKIAGMLVQECDQGLVPLHLLGNRIFFELPAPGYAPLGEHRLLDILAAIGVHRESVCNAAIIDVGAVWITLQLRSVQDVLDLKPDINCLAQATTNCTGLTVFGLYADGDSALVEVRSFVPGDAVPEDPVCGSGNGCVAAMLQRSGIAPSRYSASQGNKVGRDGRIEVEFSSDGTILIGGVSAIRVQGSISLTP
ncbi:PhzF family phenazine biosynthesis protein [Deefgea tanakiae]|uniref:PhzF family phenazine biosynthesis protein n=1 Tax=Deefgea tanakiae TaxID=2865840 RepID=A0ABX8Z6Z0_9NEIS|nr:PhzF family phenazine biosynthesis protein [Deefgea tanakiae]QZA78357.1 PhzF family phenazine biosynthesis protein [Deefgea tanakiae]